ncbi:amidohydrolase family protein [bacterium]|nr:amidohydrolase family protein [bacterium]
MLKPFFGRQPTDPEKLLSDLAECGLDGGWVSSVDSMITRDLCLQQRMNDRLAEMTCKYPGRIEGFCTVDPGGMEKAAREVERSVKDLGLIGVKLHPWLQAFSVTHPGVDLIMEMAGSLGVPVLFHDGTPPYATPRQIAWLAEKHQKTQVILGHAGLADLWRDAADAARLHSNIWLQPTAAPPITIRAAMEAAGQNRILFGTDGGFGTTGFIQYCIDKYRAALDSETFERIVLDNPRELQCRCKATSR